MEFDLILADLIKEFNDIVKSDNAISILEEWGLPIKEIAPINFPNPRPMFRTYMIKEIFKYANLHGSTKDVIKSTIPSILKIFDNLPKPEIENEAKYQSALKIISMFDIMTTRDITDTQFKYFFLKSKKLLINSAEYLDQFDREKRKDLPHVTFVNARPPIVKRTIFSSPSKPKVSIIERRKVPKTPPIKTRSDFIIKAQPDIIASPPRSPYLSTCPITTPPNPITVFKKAKNNMRTHRNSWCK